MSRKDIEQRVNLITKFEIHGDKEAQARIDELTKALDHADTIIQRLSADLDEANRKLAESADAKFVKDLETRMEAAEAKMRTLGDSMVAQFNAFREAYNLDKIDNKDFTEWAEQLRQGLIGLPQAMSEVKAKYGELMGIGQSSGGSLGADALQPVLTKLQEMSASIGGLKTQLADVSGSSGGGVASNVANLFDEITRAAESMSAETRESAQSIAGLVSEITKLGELGDRNLHNLSSIFQGLASIGRGGIGSKTVANVTLLADKLREIGDRGPIRVDFSGFKDLKISKASMSNLADNLPTIANANVDNLIKLSDVDLSKFNNLKINKGAAEELAKIAEAIQIFKEAKAGTANVTDSGVIIEGFNTPAMTRVAQGVTEVADRILNLSRVTKKGTTEILEYTNAEKTLKEVVTTRINAQGEREELSSTTEYLGKNREQLAEVEKMYTQAIRDGNEALREYAQTHEMFNMEGYDAYKVLADFIQPEIEALDNAYKNGEMNLDEYKSRLSSLIGTQKDYLSVLKSSEKVLIADEATRARERKAEEARQTEEEAKAYDQYEAAITRAYDALRKFASAETDGSDASRAAYKRVEGTAKAIRTLYADYQRTGNFEVFKAGMAEQVKYLTDNIQNLTDVRKADAQVAAQQEAAQKLYDDTLKQGVNALLKYAGAQAGSKAQGKAAYAGLSQNLEELRRLNNEYKAGKMDPKEYAARVKDVSDQIKTNTGVLQQNGSTVRSHGDRIKSAIAMYISFNRVLQLVIRSIRDMVKQSIELDTALTQMQIVTGDTNGQMEKFADTAFKAANNAGAAVTDIISGATTYARLGFSSDISARLAELTTMLQNVGNIDAQDAQDAITAVIKAFDGVDESNIESKLDELVTVGNNFPISVSQIAEGMNNASSALAAAGNTFEKSVALLTAANTTMQNASKASTGLRTITARLRNTKTELDDLGESMTESQYDDVVKALTDMNVTLVDVNGNYRDTYDIFKDIAAQWDKMSSMEQAALATKLSGTRMQAVFYSLVQNFGEAEKAYEAMAGAEGTLEAKNEVFINSIQGKINQFKNDFAKLATEIFQSDWIKDAVGVAKDLLKLIAQIAKAITGVVKALGGVKSTLAIIATIWGGVKIYKTISSIIAVTDALRKATEAGRSFTVAQKAMSIASGKVVEGAGAASAALSSAGVAAGIAITAVVATISIINSINEQRRRKAEEAAAAFGKLKEEIAEEEEKIKSLNEELETNRSRMEELSKLSSPTYAEQDELDRLKEVNGELEKQIAHEEQLLKYKQSAEAGTFAEGMWNTFFGALKNDILPSSDLFHTGKFWESAGIAGVQRSTGTELKYEIPVTVDVNHDAIDTLLHIPDMVKAANDAIEYSGGDGIYYKIGYENALPQERSQYVGKISDLQDFVGDIEDYYRATITKLNEMVQGIQFIPEPSGKDEEDADWYIRKINSIIALYEQELGDDPSLQNAFARTAEMYGFSSFDELEQSLNKGEKRAKWFIDDLRDMGIATGTLGMSAGFVKDAFDNMFGDNANGDLPSRFEDLGSKIKETGQESESAAKSISHLRDALNDLKKATTGLDMLDKIYADIANGDKFDYSSLIDDKFIEEFGGLGEAFDIFITTVANSPNDISACKSAFDDLTTAYLIQGKYLKNVNEETKDVVTQMLIEKGVANASALVNAALATNLYNVALQKAKLNETPIETAQDVQRLIDLAEGADATAQYLEQLLEIKQKFVEADTILESARKLPGKERVELVTQALDLINEAKQAVADLEDIQPHDIDISFTGGDEYQKYLDGLGKGTGSSSKTKTWFDEQLAYHKHLVAMEQETDAEYFAWLDQAYKQAYAEGIIELDDYYKYQEEVFNGLKSLVKDKLNDIEKEISFRGAYDGESKAIIGLYDEAISTVEKAIADARARGLDNNSDYMQELLQQWQKYTQGRKDVEEEVEKNAKDAIEKLVDIRKKMLDQEINDRKDALNKELSDLKDFYDKQKKMLQDSYDEEDYLEEQSEKRKSVADIEEQLAALRYDDSAWAQKKRAELQQELADAQKELSDFERDHARDEALNFLDEQQAKQEERINSEIEELEEMKKSAKEIRDEVLEDIKNGSVSLYKDMLKWNQEYGDGIDDTITDAWEGAYQALYNYSQLFGKTFNGINLANATGWVPNLKPSGMGYASGTYWAVPGLHQIDELGDETYFSSSTGKKYKMFTGGEKVLTAKASDFLYQFATNGRELLNRFVSGITGGALSDSFKAAKTTFDIAMGDIIVNGNTDRATVSEIRRAQRDSIEYILKEFNKLNK